MGRALEGLGGRREGGVSWRRRGVGPPSASGWKSFQLGRGGTSGQTKQRGEVVQKSKGGVVGGVVQLRKGVADDARVWRGWQGEGKDGHFLDLPDKALVEVQQTQDFRWVTYLPLSLG